MNNRIVYIACAMYYPNGMAKVLTDKINYLAENTCYDLYIIETERADLKPFYTLSNKVQRININLNFDDIYKMSVLKKILFYFRKQKIYKKKLSGILNEIKPSITITTLRREINFINDINDGSKKIGEIHFNKSNYREYTNPLLPTFINQFITKIWRKKLIKEIRRLDKFVVLTEEDKACWTELSNVEVISNPLITFPEVKSTCMNKKIIAAGRYTKQKGFDLLIESWRYVCQKYPDWHLDIYGAGDKSAYEELIIRYNLQRFITCHEAVSNIYERYIESSVFAFSSRFEGFGLALAEAMSCGIPAISYSCPCGPKDIITDGVDGFLVENNDIKGFANKLCYLMENASIRIKMGIQAQKNMRRFEQKIIMKKWLTLFSNF